MDRRKFALGNLVVVVCLAGTWDVGLGQVEEAWVAPFAGEPIRQMTIDTTGNVYVANRPADEGAPDYGTAKYGEIGQLLWTAFYDGPNILDQCDGPPHFSEEANALAVDVHGNVYITGCSLSAEEGFAAATVKYDPDGNEVWVARSIGAGWHLAVDVDGNVFVSGRVFVGGSWKITTLKYDADGEQVWVAFHNTDEQCRARSLVVDDAGDVYVAADSCSGDGGEDYVTLKYNQAGDHLWARVYGSSFGADLPRALVVDSQRNVYVTGSSWGGDPAVGGTSYDCATVKYDRNGSEVWVRRFDSGGDEAAVAATVDVDGNIYVEARGVGASMTLKYDPDGNELWVRQFNGLEPESIVGDSEGNVYVMGKSSDGVATVKYSPDGDKLWVAQYAPGVGAIPLRLVLDSRGGIIVAGTTEGGDVFRIRYSEPSLFLRGDCNDDGNVDISDAVCTLNWLFLGGTDPGCLAATNANGNEAVNITDPIHLLGHLFLGGPAPVSPFPGCGPGELAADKALGCVRAPKCP